MIINNNSISARAYVPYQNNISNLARTAARLSTGKKYAEATDGASELGIAHRMRLNVSGVNQLFTGMQNALSLSQTQDEILGHVSDILDRMMELATSAVDPTKTSDERDILENEFRALSTEVTDIAQDAKFNDSRLFMTSRTVRTGMTSVETIAMASVRLSQLTMVGDSVSTVTTASAAIISLKGRSKSLALMRNQVRGYAARMERVLAYTRDYSANLSAASSALSDIDVAVESGNFTKEQVVLNASQAVLAQSNGLTQGALQFLQF